MHDIPFAVDSEGGYVTMDLDVPVVVVDSELPLMELTLTNPETTPDMPVNIVGWTTALASATYGNQTIATSYLEGTRNVEIEPYFGFQQANIGFFSASVPLDVNVTNNGVNIPIPDPQPMGGNLVSTVTYSENIDKVDHYEGEDPSAYYTAYTFYNGGYLTLAEGYESQGTKVQEMHFTIEILARTPDSGGGSSNAFNFWLRDRNGGNVDDTYRYLEILDDDTTVYLDYVNLSAYKIVSFYMETADIKDTILTFKLSMTGEEYDYDYFSYEDQALFYAKSFNYMTDGVGGETENGVCEGLLDTEWAVLADEYDYMSADTKSLFSDNGTKMKSSDIEGMLDRYQYFTNINPTLYTDFMTGGGPESGPHIIFRQAEEIWPLLALFGLTTLGYFYFRKRMSHHY